MSNFNEYFKNQGAKTIVDRFFAGIDKYNPKYKIEICESLLAVTK